MKSTRIKVVKAKKPSLKAKSDNTRVKKATVKKVDTRNNVQKTKAKHAKTDKKIKRKANSSFSLDQMEAMVMSHGREKKKDRELAKAAFDDIQYRKNAPKRRKQALDFLSTLGKKKK